MLLTTDPYVKIDKDLNSLQHTIKKSDILILCTPHKDYKKLKLKHKEVIDVWGYLN